jgi:hypothetical protein
MIGEALLTGLQFALAVSDHGHIESGQVAHGAQGFNEIPRGIVFPLGICEVIERSVCRVQSIV